MSDVAGSFVVTRHSMTMPTRALSVGIAVILSIAALYFWQLPHGAIEATQRFALVVIPILIASFLGGGTVYDVIRGRRPVLEVDRKGIWVRGMPRLAWSDVADVRTEEIVYFVGLQKSSGTSLNVAGLEIELGRGSVTPLQEAVNNGDVSVRRRLGIVPRHPWIVPETGATSGITAWVERKDAETAARIGRTPIEHAPFGLYDRDMDAIFEDVVAEIRRFHEVRELSDLEGVTRPPAR